MSFGAKAGRTGYAIPNPTVCCSRQSGCAMGDGTSRSHPARAKSSTFPDVRYGLPGPAWRQAVCRPRHRSEKRRRETRSWRRRAATPRLHGARFAAAPSSSLSSSSPAPVRICPWARLPAGAREGERLSTRRPAPYLASPWEARPRSRCPLAPPAAPLLEPPPAGEGSATR
jgi:hypothetical protein